MNKLTTSKQDKLFQEIATLIESSKKNVISTINREMVILYWNVGISLIPISSKITELIMANRWSRN